MPITDQVTARNTSAATSRQPAPRASRICGTEAELSRARGWWAGVAGAAGSEVVVGTAPGVDARRSTVSSSSARVSVVNRSRAVSPSRESAQTGQEAEPGVIEAPQSGQRVGSA